MAPLASKTVPTTPTTPTNRQARGEARRRQIIAEAAELLAAKGFRGMGLTELAERAGLTHPGLLYYFGTKERLLSEVVEERQRIEATAISAIADDTAASLAMLPQVAEANVANLTYTRLYLVLAAENFDEGDVLHDFFVDRNERTRKVARAAIRNDIKAGRIRGDVDVDQLALEVIATLQGLELQWLMDAQRVDYLASVQLYVDGLLARLAP